MMWNPLCNYFDIKVLSRNEYQVFFLVVVGSPIAELVKHILMYIIEIKIETQFYLNFI